jgi:hypothetical protein
VQAPFRARPGRRHRWVARAPAASLASVIIAVLILLSLILMATTVFPNIDVTRVALLGGAVLALGLAGFALATLRSRKGAPEPPTDESAIPREQWTMPPLTLLSRPTWSTGRKIAMLTMRGYLLTSMVLLIVKAVQLGGG